MVINKKNQRINEVIIFFHNFIIPWKNSVANFKAKNPLTMRRKPKVKKFLFLSIAPSAVLSPVRLLPLPPSILRAINGPLKRKRKKSSKSEE